MTEDEEVDKYIGINYAHGKRLSHAATEVFVRHFPPLVSDEPPSRGGEDRGQSPLELILAALCA